MRPILPVRFVLFCASLNHPAEANQLALKGTSRFKLQDHSSLAEGENSGSLRALGERVTSE